ncbi:MAG: hypothetical protein QNJ46_18790, partial [Leptolyngbyaceae cyanobacterium MO_188.B28]|nr:hypothetical protein [Leptolyngbyaceae cyanobacterium MO_188.B28]
TLNLSGCLRFDRWMSRVDNGQVKASRFGVGLILGRLEGRLASLHRRVRPRIRPTPNLLAFT